MITQFQNEIQNTVLIERKQDDNLKDLNTIFGDNIAL